MQKDSDFEDVQKRSQKFLAKHLPFTRTCFCLVAWDPLCAKERVCSLLTCLSQYLVLLQVVVQALLQLIWNILNILFQTSRTRLLQQKWIADCQSGLYSMKGAPART